MLYILCVTIVFLCYIYIVVTRMLSFNIVQLVSMKYFPVNFIFFFFCVFLSFKMFF